MKDPLHSNSNIDAQMAQRLAQIYCALSDGDVKEAEDIYREISLRNGRGRDSGSAVERAPVREP
jgi:hypothetical protein